MKCFIKQMALTMLSAILFCETAVGYPAVAYAAEDDMTASFCASESPGGDESPEDEDNKAGESEAGENEAGESITISEEDSEAGEGVTVPEESAAAEDGSSSEEVTYTEDSAAEDISDAEDSAAESSSESEGELVPIEMTDDPLLVEKDFCSGYCGENALWEYDKNAGTLKISGSGAMYDYSPENPSPWTRFVHYITDVEICEGITHIGAFSFMMATEGYVQLSSATFLGDEYEDYPKVRPSEKDVFIIKNISFPGKSLKSIGESAFENVIFDTELVIPETITELPRRAFYKIRSNSTYGGEKVVLPAGLKVIGEECFADGLEYMSINIPEKIEVIGRAAFRHNLSCEELVFPESLREIGEKAFLGVEYLENVVFEGNAPEVGEKAFLYADVTAYYPKGNTTFTAGKKQEIGKTFKAIRWIEGDDAVLTGQAGANIRYTIDQKTRKLSFEGSGAMYDYSFYDLPAWTNAEYYTISIDSRITSIGDYCFYCTEGKALTSFPGTLERVGMHAFEHFAANVQVNSLEVDIKRVEEHGFYLAMFKYSDNRTFVKIKGVTYVGDSAFAYCLGYPFSVDISDLVYVGKEALNCSHITEGSTFSKNIEYIGELAFNSTHRSDKIKLVLPATLKYLGKGAFNYCDWIESEVELDGNDLMLERYVFDDTNVTSLVIGGGVTSIAGGALELGKGTEQTIKFMGNRPEFYSTDNWRCADGVTISCYYPADNKTWLGIDTEDRWNSSAYRYETIEYIPYGGMTVNFYDVNGVLTDTKTIGSAQTIAEPSEEKRGLANGQVFAGWFTDKDIHNSVTKWDFSKSVNCSMDLYAGVVKDTCTVRFITNCDKTLDDMVVKKGSTVYLQEINEGLNYPDRIIDKWYKNGGSDWEFYFFTVMEDTVLSALWTGEGQYLNFDYCSEGKTPGRYFIQYGSKIDRASSDDFFRGWYTDRDYSGEPVGEILNKGDLEPETTLYARWEKRNQAKIEVSGYERYVEYTGAAITFPDLTVKDNGKLLIRGKDYTVKYKNNKKIGWANIILTFKGDYTGTKTVEFMIEPKGIYDENIVWDQHPIIVMANGKVQLPKPKLYEKSGNKLVALKENVDYKLSYQKTDASRSDYNPSAFKDPGTWYMEIEGEGRFGGVIITSVRFYEGTQKHVNALKVDKIKATTLNEDETLIEPEIRVYDGKTLLERDKDYKLTFEEEPVIGMNMVTISAVSGSGYIGTRNVFFSVTGKSLSKTYVKGFNKSLPYNGGDGVEQELELYVSKAAAQKGIGKLVEGRDYTVTYMNNSLPGKATVVITATGKLYTGKITKTYTITGQSIKSAKVEGIENRTYSGEALVQENLRVFFRKNAKDEKRYLENSMEERAFLAMDDCPEKRAVSWIYSYANNVKPGKATITITGVNGYTGSLKKTFKIGVLSLEDAGDRLSMHVDEKVSYMKGKTCPNPTVTYGEEVLKLGRDYTLSYKNNKKQGDHATVTAKLKGRFKGTLTGEFDIVRGDISKCTVVTKDIATYKSKKSKKTTVTIYDLNGAKLTPGVDYDTEFDYLRDGIEVDVDGDNYSRDEDITVVIYGKGNYANTETTAIYRTALFFLGDTKVRFRCTDNSPLYKEYTGKPLEFSKDDIVIYTKRSNNNYLSLDDDEYEIVGYRNNVDIGTGVMIIRGKGSYCGTREIKFSITKKVAK